MGRTIRAGGLIALTALAGAGAGGANAQSSSASPYSRGYSSTSGEYANPVNVSTRDANGNRTIVDGVIQTGNDNSIFSRLNVNGALDSVSGAGTSSSSSGSSYGTATAIGNNLVVVTSGSYNTVIVNATQTNNGPITATTTVLNGQVDLGGGH